MVICKLEVFHPFHTLLSTFPMDDAVSKKGFRLLEASQRHLQDPSESGSIYSVYKQKIDSMFESDSSQGGESRRRQAKNSVQARIERMFVDVVKEEGLVDGGVELGTAVHSFSVDYLGSVELNDKVSNLAGLQEPLKKLYFKYKSDRKEGKREQTPMGERLEISQAGLKVQYRNERGEMEQLNPFPSIAVWSAVKFVLQHPDKSNEPSYAFLPLITDPDNLEKQALFRQLDPLEMATFRAQANNADSHAPLFAVVMRSSAVITAGDSQNVYQKQQRKRRLECHGFVCQTSEDAIVIAATLYKSLMAHMNKAKEGRRPKTTKEGISCMSATSSVTDWNGGGGDTPVRPPRKKRSVAGSSIASINSDKDRIAEVDDTRPLFPTNISALYAKKSTKTRRAPEVPLPRNEDLDAITPYEEVQGPSIASTAKEKHSYVNSGAKVVEEQLFAKKELEEAAESPMRGQSIRKSVKSGGKVVSANPNEQGDILTKVTIPRSGSFLNAGGLTKYKSKANRNNGQATGGSPLGFDELFNEFRLQEGLHSVDEILGVIIDPEGMSFNDLKPIYKEFLLKLALTLTKDELFQRSKAIMKKHRKKVMRSRGSFYKQKKRSGVVSSKLKSIQHAFGKKLKAKLKGKLGGKKVQKRSNKFRNAPQLEIKLPESSISTSSYDTRHFRPKEQLYPVTRKASHRKRSSANAISDSKSWQRSKERVSTSEESDLFSLQRAKTRPQENQQTGGGSNPNRNSSSGYVSCSECSYDSDTCTCASADKCYCSLGHRNPTAKVRTVPSCPGSSRRRSARREDRCYCSWKPPMEGNSSLTYCGCDTDSCSDSNKCYCKKGDRRRSSRYRNNVPSEVRYMEGHKKLCKKNSNTKSTKSLEYIHGPSEQYYQKLRYKTTRSHQEEPMSQRRRSYDNMMLDLDVWSGRNVGNFSNSRRNSTCVQSSGYYKQASVRSFQSSTKYTSSHQTGKTLCSAMSTSGCTEALSVKKSAEMAALFADVKLSQTTDITHLIPPRDYETDSGRRNNACKVLAAKEYGHTGRSRTEKGYTKADKRKQDSSTQPPVPLVSRVMSNPVYAAQKYEKTKMYSAKNGLYTIQSQSDESRRSSFSGDKRDQIHMENNIVGRNVVSNSLENSLGYLP